MSDSTPVPSQCPRCGGVLPVDAPEGLCPRCLAALHFGPETEITGEAGTRAQPPLTPAELAPHFPQLEILECLGRGGMGVVYKARQKSLNRLVALKLLVPERAHDAEFAERFTREAHALAALNHPHIVTVYDFGQAGGFYFLLMEFVDGVSLRQAMNARRFTPEQALAVVPAVCEALQYAHEHGIVHRDIKPENLLLDKDGRVKIADFGIARMLGDDSRTGLVDSQPAGTPQYMAPEQKDHQHTDHRADIYSLGVVLYELLTGELPADKLQPPSSRIRGMTIDVRLDEIVLRALEKEPELRYQTAGDFRTQLETLTHAAPPEQVSPVEIEGSQRLVPALIFLALYATFLCWIAQSSSLLPARPASHFDVDGNANGWMDRSTYLLLIAALPGLLAALFWMLSQAAIHFPAIVNIPRRDYWLAPERRAATAALLLRWLLGLACGLVFFFGALHGLVIKANQLNPAHLQAGSLLILVIAFLLALMIWLATLMMRMADAGHGAKMERRPAGVPTAQNQRQSASATAPSRKRWHGWDAWIISLCLVVFGAWWLERLQRGILQSDHPLKSTFVEVKVGSKDQLTQLRADLTKEQAGFQAFITKNNMAFWQEQGKSAALFLSGLKNQQAQLLNELQRLENLSPDELLVTPIASAPHSELSVQYTQATQQLIQKQAELEEWKAIGKPRHPKLEALQSKVEDLQRLISVIKQQNAAATQGRVAAIKAELKSLESSIANWEQKLLEANSKDAEYQTLRSAVTSTQGQIEKLLGNTR